MTDGIDHVDRWNPWGVQVMLTGGPDRIYDDAPKPDRRPPVGFVAAVEAAKEAEPLTWDGDNA